MRVYSWIKVIVLFIIRGSIFSAKAWIRFLTFTFYYFLLLSNTVQLLCFFIIYFKGICLSIEKQLIEFSLKKRLTKYINLRAHKIIETPAGREYIPDTNSNNLVNLDAIYPAPNAYENKRGFMLRPVGKNWLAQFS